MGADGESIHERGWDRRAGTLHQPAPDPGRADRAAYALAERQPDRSAIRTLTRLQVWVYGMALLAAVLLACLQPAAFFPVSGGVGFVFFVAALCFRCATYVAGTTYRYPQFSDRDGEGVIWPAYTLLIALKDEAASAPQLADAIRKLDYPDDRLDVKLLIEAGDEATRRALVAQSWPPATQLLVVPSGMPRTKPRALNYGLMGARGEFVVVYDAEDRPDPGQLKAAVRAFEVGGTKLACVQAPLVGEGDRGWLAGQWALEYAVQFGRFLPGLALLGLPIMLGGTSNHFRRSHLEAAGGWDPWNVTEDADLGVRLASRGEGVGVIAPPTYEAPPEQLSVWISQRSRWLKGFLQTWLVVMRRPGAALRSMGPSRFLALQLTLGAAILSALAHGPWAVWLVIALAAPGIAIPAAYLWFVGIAYAAGIMMAFLAPGEQSGRRLLMSLTLPLYWPLQSIAMVRAVYSLARRPHYWAKTPHPEQVGQVSAPEARVNSPAS